jgi:alpha 1,2-mannosyltransferase
MFVEGGRRGRRMEEGTGEVRMFYGLVASMLACGALLLIVFVLFVINAIRTAHPAFNSMDAADQCMGRGHRANAVILVLCRNEDLGGMLRTMRDFERRFNRRHCYPYLFLNDRPWTFNFRQTIRAHTRSAVKFGLVPPEHWDVPQTHVNQSRLQESLRSTFVYGRSLSYRQMCRWFSGFFFRHPLVLPYDWYWRLEPGVSFPCDITFDPFREMQRHGKLYAFTIALPEIPETIPSLWSTIQGMNVTPADPGLLGSFLDPVTRDYNQCHFWSNFEIGSLAPFRSPTYRAFFAALDAAGGFFHERWGDAPVHTLALAHVLRRSDLLWLGDRLGYWHPPHGVCPRDFLTHTRLRCECDPQALGTVHPESACMSPFSNLTLPPMS